MLIPFSPRGVRRELEALRAVEVALGLVGPERLGEPERALGEPVTEALAGCRLPRELDEAVRVAEREVRRAVLGEEPPLGALPGERDRHAPADGVHPEPVTEVVDLHHPLDVEHVLHRRRAEQALELRDLRLGDALGLDRDVFATGHRAVRTCRILGDVVGRERLTADRLGDVVVGLLELVVPPAELAHLVDRVDEPARAVVLEHPGLAHERPHPADGQLLELLARRGLGPELALADRNGLDVLRAQHRPGPAPAGDPLAELGLVEQARVADPVLAGRARGDDVGVVALPLAVADRRAGLVGTRAREVGGGLDRRAVLR
ncbi:MAG: hypothetical protein U5J98_05410 [Halobacteriales archaeon]|nr:hypothetical protein [Halobacteriales archaeon]